MAAHQELAGGAVGNGGEQFVDDAGVEAVAQGADIAGPLFLGGGADDEVGLGGAESVDQGDAEPLAERLPGVGRCRRESPRTARWARSCGPGGWASSIGTMAPSR
ncbi:hypothetical protein GCM10017744_009940 [Streptomyces antimycoticus]